MNSKLALVHSLYQIGTLKFGEFTLKSGKSSNIYLDLRQIISYPNVLQEVSSAIFEKFQSAQFDLLCGVPYTALPIATCISLQHSIPMIMRRKEKKAYGTKQQIEGKFSPGQTCMVIEDVITSGMSVLETTTDLSAAGLRVTDLAVLIDREQGGKENLQQHNLHVHAVFTLSEILQELYQSKLLTGSEKSIVNELLKEKI